MEPRGQRGLLRLRQLRHIRVQIARQAERQLPAHERRKAAEGIEQPAVQPPGRTLRGKQRRQLLLRHGERIPLSLRGRQMVVKPRQDLPLFGHLKIDPAQAIEDPPVRARQDEVRVAAHDLEDEVLLRGASHLVGAVEGEVQQPLHLRLLHPDQPPARQMLTQQHAEHRRLRRVFRRFIRQMDARMIGRGREQQFSAAGRAAVQSFRLRPSHELGLPGLGPPHHQGPVFLCVHGSSSSTRGSSTTPLSVPSACTPWSFSDRATAARSFSTAVASFRPFIVPGSSAPLRRFSRCRAFSSRTCCARSVLRMSVALLRLSSPLDVFLCPMVRVGSSFLPGGSGLWQQLTTPRAAATVCAFSGPFRIFKHDFFKSYNFES